MCIRDRDWSAEHLRGTAGRGGRRRLAPEIFEHVGYGILARWHRADSVIMLRNSGRNLLELVYRRIEESAGKGVRVLPAGTEALVVEPLRNRDMEMILRPGERNVEKAPFLFEASWIGERHVRRDVPVRSVNHEHGPPLPALRRVDRGENEVVVVEMRRYGQVAGAGRWVERDLGEKATPRSIFGCER